MDECGSIYLVDDDLAVLDSLCFLMKSYGFELRCFNCGATFLETVDLTAPGCVILDSRMPGLSGERIHQRLLEVGSPIAVIFLTGHGDVPMVREAFLQGAHDFFQKPVKGQDLARALREAIGVSQQRWELQRLRCRLSGLTERELSVFRLVVKGLTNKQIAAELFVTVRTIEVHRARVMSKLGVENMAELMSLAHLVA
ncbi:response regulator [Ferrimonas pelagia]|uniref:Response regulator n=1 Tax=Ferrimonas pelagia TaxID=1177826 RepID=A0ABP9F7W1_9GAMM